MQHKRTNDWLRHAALLQLWLVFAVLSVCLLIPRHDGAVLLLRVFGAGRPIIAGGHIAVLRQGWLPGSLLVRFEGDVSSIALLRGGIVPVAAPMLLCAPVEPAENRALERATSWKN